MNSSLALFRHAGPNRRRRIDISQPTLLVAIEHTSLPLRHRLQFFNISAWLPNYDFSRSLLAQCPKKTYLDKNALLQSDPASLRGFARNSTNKALSIPDKTSYTAVAIPTAAKSSTEVPPHCARYELSELVFKKVKIHLEKCNSCYSCSGSGPCRFRSVQPGSPRMRPGTTGATLSK
jgi:hypothetical protein